MSNILLSRLMRLSRSDLVRGAWNAVFVAVIAMLWKATQQPNFNVLMIDWGAVLNAAIYGFVGFLATSFSSDERGAVLGKFGAFRKENSISSNPPA